MADNVDSLVLSGCECSKTITPPTYSPENTLEYVKVKKTFLANYLKELKLHSTPFYKPDDHIPILLLIQAAQANFLSITVFESSILHDGSSIRETRESKA